MLFIELFNHLIMYYLNFIDQSIHIAFIQFIDGNIDNFVWGWIYCLVQVHHNFGEVWLLNRVLCVVALALDWAQVVLTLGSFIQMQLHIGT
jgi:hypothetical protein